MGGGIVTPDAPQVSNVTIYQTAWPVVYTASDSVHILQQSHIVSTEHTLATRYAGQFRPITSLHAALPTFDLQVDLDTSTAVYSLQYSHQHTMRAPLLAICGLAAAAHSASAWSFQDASVRVNSKGAGIDAGERHTLSTTSPLSTPLSLGAADTLKLLLTVVDDTTPSRAHQAFLTLHDPTTGLSDSFPLSVKESGKAKLELVRSLLLHGNVPHTDPPQTHKDLPHQLLTSPSLRATLLLASFGASPPYSGEVFTITPTHDNPASITPPPATVRYHALPEIKHVFRADPRSPAFIISAVFALAVVAALPVLLGAWLAAGANVGHLGKAVGRAPLSHAAFYGSVAGIEGVFFLYYTSWNLFKTLPVVAVLGVVAVLSGSRALSEVQERRLAGER